MRATYPAVETRLARYGAMTAEAVLPYLAQEGSPADLYQVASEYPRRGGKAIRPSLCLAACAAYGGPAEEAILSAAAIELLHNAFLVHDDVEDASLLRRGRPTLHVIHGVPLAINAGDAAGGSGAGPVARQPPQARHPAGDGRGRGVRSHGAAHPRRPGHGAGLAPAEPPRPDPRALPGSGPAQDVLVHDDPPVARRRLDRIVGHCRSGPTRGVWLLFGGGLPDRRRLAQPGRRQQPGTAKNRWAICEKASER